MLSSKVEMVRPDINKVAMAIVEKVLWKLLTL